MFWADILCAFEKFNCQFPLFFYIADITFYLWRVHELHLWPRGKCIRAIIFPSRWSCTLVQSIDSEKSVECYSIDVPATWSTLQAVVFSTCPDKLVLRYIRCGRHLSRAVAFNAKRFSQIYIKQPIGQWLLTQWLGCTCINDFLRRLRNNEYNFSPGFI